MSSQNVIDEWIVRASSSDMKVWVDNPETVKDSGFMAKPYTTFRVLMRAGDSELVGVRHRFSEFCSLRDRLKARYCPYGIMVPSLPSKKITKVIGKLEREFITERMQGLTLFCEAIIANPWLRSDVDWLQFMSPSGFASGAGAEEMLQKMLETVPMPTLPLERIYDFKDELNVVDKQMQGVLDAAKAVQKAQSQMQAANEGLHQAVEGWSAVESNSAVYLSGRSHEVISSGCRLPETSKVPLMVSSLNTLSAEGHVATLDLAEYGNILFSCFVEHELARSDSFRECIKFHDELLSSIDSLRVKVEKLDAQQASKWDQLQEAKQSLETKNQTLSMFYKGLYFFSIPMNAKLRSDNLRRMMAYTGSTALVTAHTLQSSSRSFLAKLKINPEQAVSDTSHCLDMLSLKPLEALPEGIAAGVEEEDTQSCWIAELYSSASGKALVGGAAVAAVSTRVPTAAATPSSPIKTSGASTSPSSPPPVPKSTNPFADEPESTSAPANLAPAPVNQALLGELVGSDSDKVKTDRNADLFG